MVGTKLFYPSSLISKDVLLSLVKLSKCIVIIMFNKCFLILNVYMLYLRRDAVQFNKITIFTEYKW